MFLFTPNSALRLALALACCGTASTTAFAQAGAITKYLNSLPDIKTPPNSQFIVNQSAPATTGYNNSRVTCRIDRIRDQGSILQLAAYGSRNDVLWPGSLLQGSSLISNQLSPVTLSRGPMAIAVTAFVPGYVPNSSISMETIGATISDPRLQSVTDAIHNLVFPHPGAHQPANMAFTSAQVYSAEQATLTIAASYSTIGADITSYLNAQNYANRSHVVAQFAQQYYTVAVTPPVSPEDFFKKHTNIEALKLQTSQSSGPNPVVYVNTVTYGRIAYIFLSSVERGDKLKAAVDASFSGLLTNGNLSGNAEQQSVVRNAGAQVFVSGGDADAGTELTQNKVGGLGKWIRVGGTFSETSPGAPISFSTRYLRSDYRMAGASFTTDYNESVCVPSPERIISIRYWYTLTDDKDRGNSQRFLALEGAQIAGGENWNGAGIVWRDHNPNPYAYSGNIALSVPVSECGRLTLRTEQSGNDGATEGNGWVEAATDAGRKALLVSGQHFKLKDTDHTDWSVNCSFP